MKSIFHMKYSGSYMIPPLPGYAFPLLWRLAIENQIDFPYWFRYGGTALLSGLGMPFRWWERKKTDRAVAEFKINQSPVFILGHWRSGTTHLHNLLCQDPKMGYLTTFQAAFPENLLAEPGRTLYYKAMKRFMPRTRKGDNVEMAPAYPQEEEFALGSRQPIGFYSFLLFPRRIREYYAKYIRFEGISEAMETRWREEYLRLIKKSLLNIRGERFVSKNPSNTGRIRQLLHLFPNAQFIFIYRNPFVVFQSVRKFFKSILPMLQFQHISSQQLEVDIVWLYKRLMKDYLQDRVLIPSGQLTEIRFEELEAQPIDQIRGIYQKLDLPGFQEALSNFETYIRSKQHYQKNQYQFSESEIQKIHTQWGFALEEWEYGLP